VTIDHLRLFRKEWSKSEIEENVEVTHMLLIFLINSFWVGLSFPCCGFHVSGIPVQDVVSGLTVVDEVSDFADFNDNLCSCGEIH
jgi:hypothetical protein